MIAWTLVDRTLRQKGTYVDVVFDDPLIHRVLHDMGGWIALGQKTEVEWPLVAREFETRYRGFHQRSEIPDHPKKLIGIANAHNMSKGLPLEPCVLVGDVEKCKQIMSSGIDKPLVQFKTFDSSLPDLRLAFDGKKKVNEE